MVAVAVALLLAGGAGLDEFAGPALQPAHSPPPSQATNRQATNQNEGPPPAPAHVAAIAPVPVGQTALTFASAAPGVGLDIRPDPAATLVPGSRQSFRDTLADGHVCLHCPQMVVVPAGSFTMGSWVGEIGHDDDESPSHRVTISRLFAVGKYAVTRGEFAAFVKATGYAGGRGCYIWNLADWTPNLALSWRDPGFAQTDRHPVVCVSFIDARAYVAWLQRETARPYRLLSEAEWEYAARAGTQARYFFGDDETKFCRYGNGADLSLTSIAPPQPKLTCRDGYAFTAPVGRFRPNGFGLYDMLGNVRQWVADCVHRSYRGAPAGGTAWIDEAGDCRSRVQRGGSWLRSADRLRAASRLWSAATDRWFDGGFRLARAIDR